MESRVRKVEKRLGDGEPEHGMIQFVDTTRWSDADQERFRTGAPEERAALIEAHTGQKPPPPGGAIRLVIDVNPPPIEPADAIAEAERILGEGSQR